VSIDDVICGQKKDIDEPEQQISQQRETERAAKLLEDVKVQDGDSAAQRRGERSRSCSCDRRQTRAPEG